MALTGIVGPLIFAPLYAIFIGPKAPFQSPGIPFLLSAILMAISLVIALGVTRVTGRSSQNQGFSSTDTTNPVPKETIS